MINTALLKEQLKRFWGLSALLFVGYALTIALPLSMGSWIRMENEFRMFSLLIAPLIAVIVLFMFQNQVKSSIAMHSYPLTRNQLLATNALAGMLLLVLPLIAFCVMIFPILLFHSDALNSILDIGHFFSITALSLLFYFSLFTVAAMLSGNSIITLLLCVALPLLPIGIYMLATAICEFYVFGFYSRTNLDEYLAFIHPIFFSRGGGRVEHKPFQIVSYSLIIIAAAACCVLAANKRAHEREGDSVAFPYVKNALVFVLSVSGLLFMGFILFEMFTTVSAMYIGFAIGFFIAYCIAQMIIEKTFNILNKMKDFIKFGAVTLGLLLLIIVSTSSDMFGYERYVPRFADIEGVQMIDVHFLLQERNALRNSVLNELLVKDSEIINETIAFHQAIINEREALKRYDFERARNSRFARRSFSILYKLRNGNVIVRHYHLPSSFVDENNLHGLLIRSRLSVSLLQNKPDLIGHIEILAPFDANRQSEDNITRHDHILEFINVLSENRDLLVAQNTPDRTTRIRVLFGPEGSRYNRRINSLLFDFGPFEGSHVHRWLLENGYW